MNSEPFTKEEEAQEEASLYQTELPEDVSVPTPSQGMSYTISLLESN